jgi:hypothetical protein
MLNIFANVACGKRIKKSSQFLIALIRVSLGKSKELIDTHIFMLNNSSYISYKSFIIIK